MDGLQNLLIPIIDWALRIAGAASLVVVAVFIVWWLS